MTRKAGFEAQALRLTAIGALGMAILGLGFAIVTKSEAILLDGFYSLIGFVVAVLTQKVSRLVMKPGNEHYPFGYAVFEPMINLTKGLLIGTATLFALVSAIVALFTGGRTIAEGIAIAYASVATVGCFWLAWRIHLLAKLSGSKLVEVDAKSWIVDGAISATVAVVLLLIKFTKGTPIEALLPYADPALVILLVVATISVPIQIIRDAWRQIIGYRPGSKKVMKIDDCLIKVFKTAPLIDWRVRPLEIGRFLYIHVYVIDVDGGCGDLARQDRLRARLYAALSKQFDHVNLDVIFTQQRKWADWH